MAVDERRVRPFGEFLEEQGSTMHDCGLALAELVEKVILHGKPGKLILELTVKPAAKGGDIGVVSVADKITLRAPASDRGERVFFALPSGGLSRRDPRQPELPFNEPAGTEEADR